MSFFGLLRGRSRKASSKPAPRQRPNRDLLGFDLLYQLTYLSAVAAAGIPRSHIFKLGAELPCTTAGYFHEVHRLAQSMNYQYAEACRLVGESVREPEVKSLLLRLSSSLATGEQPADFMNHEAHVQAEAYGNVYERNLEALRKWTDAYIALMVSVALIIVVATISTVIYNMGAGFLIGLVVVMLGISGLGSWIIYRTAPREVKTLPPPRGNLSQRLPRLLFLILVPGAMMAAAVLLMAGVPLGWVLAVVGVMLLPIGIAGWRLDAAVSRRDEDMSTFLRVLGATASATGTTPMEAMGRIDLRAIGSLAPAVQRLYTMLRSRVRPELCWGRFVVETGSELINRGARVFLDGVSLGGEAEEVGSRASLLTMKVNFMRAKRKLVSSTFGYLCLIMHITIVFLLLFVIEVVEGFSGVVMAAGMEGPASGSVLSMSSILSFDFQSLDFLRQLVVPVVIILSVVNAITPKVTDGGYSHKFFFYLGVTLAGSGLSLALAPTLARLIFSVTT